MQRIDASGRMWRVRLERKVGSCTTGLSVFYCKYNQRECDQEYTSCLKGKRKGITIKSFFYNAKESGVAIQQAEQGVGQQEQEQQKGKRLDGYGVYFKMAGQKEQFLREMRV